MYSNDPFAFLQLGMISVVIILFYLIFVVGIFLLLVYYVKTIIEVMVHVRPSNRLTGVSNILLNYVPLVNIVYGFIVYPKICDSIKNEYKTLGLPEDGDFGKGLAITLQALTLTMFIPFLNFLTSIAGLVLWILLWVKFNKYLNDLKSMNGNGFSDKAAISNSSDILD